MIGGGQHADLRDVIELVETAIESVSFVDDSSDLTAYSLLDRLDQWAHLGVVVASPSSEDTDRTDGVSSIWVQDEVTVALRVHVARNPGQRVMRNLALDHELRLKTALCSDASLQLYRPTWVRTARTPSADRAWLELVLTLNFERFERLRRL